MLAWHFFLAKLFSSARRTSSKHSKRTTSASFSTSKNALNFEEHVAESSPADSDTEKAIQLPADIWLLIAEIYLIDSPATVAALSSTNRQFRALLRHLVFRAVSIRLELSSTETVAANTSTSSALRFAQLVQSKPDIIGHIQILWIGHQEDVNLRAINDEFSDDSERRNLCYILSRRYPYLKHLAFSFRYASIKPYTRRLVPTLPNTVLHSILSVLSLSSLVEVSIFMGSIPWEVYSRLQEIQIDTLNIGARMINQEGFPPQGRTDWRSQTSDKLQTLRIDTSEGKAINTLLPELLHAVVTTNSLQPTTLVLKSTTFQAAFYLPRNSCPTVKTLQLYFLGWHAYIPRSKSNIVDLKAFSALQTLTLGFNLIVKSPPVETAGRQRLKWILDVLWSIKPDQPIQCVNLFIDDLHPSGGWINKIDDLPWSDLPSLFSSVISASSWPTLEQINIGFAASDEEFKPSDWVLLKKTLRPKLALLLDSGILRLHAPIFSKSAFLDDFWSTMRLRS